MITLPWNDKTAPNVMISILDRCNLRCEVCYRRHAGVIKSITDIKQDLEAAERLRDLHMVTITGGEPTLHPDLLEIVSLVKRKGFHTAMATNGVLLDKPFLSRLRSAGLDSILFHVDSGQTRPDLPRNADLEDIKQRLYELLDTAVAMGFDVSFTWTILDFSEIDFVLRMFLEKQEVSLLFLSKGIDPETLPPFSDPPQTPKVKVGSDDSGHQSGKRNGRQAGCVTPSMRRMTRFIHKKFGIRPFASVPVFTVDGQRIDQPIFVTYFLPVVYNHNSVRYLYPLRSNAVDRALMYLPRLLKGRFIHKTTQDVTVTALRVLFNGISRLRFDLLHRFFSAAWPSNRSIRSKTIVYDDGPMPMSDGSIAVCEYCPTAIVKNNRLVRCCEIYHDESAEA